MKSNILKVTLTGLIENQSFFNDDLSEAIKDLKSIHEDLIKTGRTDRFTSRWFDEKRLEFFKSLKSFNFKSTRNDERWTIDVSADIGEINKKSAEKKLCFILAKKVLNLDDDAAFIIILSGKRKILVGEDFTDHEYVPKLIPYRHVWITFDTEHMYQASKKLLNIVTVDHPLGIGGMVCEFDLNWAYEKTASGYQITIFTDITKSICIKRLGWYATREVIKQAEVVISKACLFFEKGEERPNFRLYGVLKRPDGFAHDLLDLSF